MAKKLTKDVVERAAWTFVQTGLGTMGVDSLVERDIPLTMKAGAAALAGATSAVKGIVAARFGDKDSASTVKLEEGGT